MELEGALIFDMTTNFQETRNRFIQQLRSIQALGIFVILDDSGNVNADMLQMMRTGVEEVFGNETAANYRGEMVILMSSIITGYSGPGPDAGPAASFAPQ